MENWALGHPAVRDQQEEGEGLMDTRKIHQRGGRKARRLLPGSQRNMVLKE